jgi:hypothetical protein
MVAKSRAKPILNMQKHENAIIALICTSLSRLREHFWTMNPILQIRAQNFSTRLHKIQTIKPNLTKMCTSLNKY